MNRLQKVSRVMMHKKNERIQGKNKKLLKPRKFMHFLGIDLKKTKNLLTLSIANEHRIWALLESGIGRLKSINFIENTRDFRLKKA